jgi:hypothetical protein
MNLDKYNALSAADKAVIDRHSGEAFATLAGKGWDKINANGKEQALAAGNKIVVAPAALVDEVKRLNIQFEADYLAGAKKIGVDGAAALKFFKAEVAKLENK